MVTMTPAAAAIVLQTFGTPISAWNLSAVRDDQGYIPVRHYPLIAVQKRFYIDFEHQTTGEMLRLSLVRTNFGPWLVQAAGLYITDEEFDDVLARARDSIQRSHDEAPIVPSEGS